MGVLWGRQATDLTVFFDDHFVFAHFKYFAELYQSILDFTDHSTRYNFAFFVNCWFKLNFRTLWQPFVDIFVETLSPSRDGAFRVEGMVKGVWIIGLVWIALDFIVFLREWFSALRKFALFELNFLLFFFKDLRLKIFFPSFIFLIKIVERLGTVRFITFGWMIGGHDINEIWFVDIGLDTLMITG
jgi:hypothetical protein